MHAVPQPPNPPQRPYEHVAHGVRRSDPFHWLRETSSADVLAHLRSEREWFDTSTAHSRSFIEALETEMVSRTAPEDTGVPWTHREKSYYTRYPAGKDYAQFVRQNPPSRPFSDTETALEAPLGDENRIEVLLDANSLGEPGGYVDLGLLQVSPDGRWLAYSVDLVGEELFTLRFRDLTSGEDLPDEVPRTYYGGAWDAGSASFLYTVPDHAYRPHEVRRHVLGTAPDGDELVVAEPDERFELNVRACRSGDVAVVWSASRDTAECWAVDLRTPGAAAWSVGGRRPGVEYHAEHDRERDRLLVVTDDDAPEFRLAAAPVPRSDHQDHTTWQELRPEDPEERLERVDAFADHLVMRLRAGGQRRLRLLPSAVPTAEGTLVTPQFAGGTLDLGPNVDYDAAFVTVEEQSYTQPSVWSDVDLGSGERRERHRRSAPGHDPAAYVTETQHATAPDGTLVPVTVVRHRDAPLDGTSPCLLYGYGAYEYVFEPEWDAALPSLLDRGVVFAHAHVRGGGERGRRWWLDGRLAHKQNTFTDFAAVADHLDGQVDGRRIAARGLSAGGLLMGAVFSQRPDRWRAVVAEVPFVDVVSTMSDPSIPLTVNEWDEWGDPRQEDEFRWMLAYSPYDNLPPAGGRPDLLVTGALHDPRVMVWEPAKWVAALRTSDPAWGPRCQFRCETGAGSHVGPAGRLAHLRYEAEVQAWLLERLVP